jgi:hypothetical protein
MNGMGERHWREQLGAWAIPDHMSATRRRLCLQPERDDELAAALIGLGVDGEQRDLGSFRRRTRDDLVGR